MPATLTNEEQLQHDLQKTEDTRQAYATLIHYLSETGIFADWKENKETFILNNGDDPLLIWAHLHCHSTTSRLADFMHMLLSIVVNKASTECTFSNLKIKQTQLCNCVQLNKFEKMSKVNALIRMEDSKQNVFITTPELWKKELAGWAEKEKENGLDAKEGKEALLMELLEANIIIIPTLIKPVTTNTAWYTMMRILLEQISLGTTKEIEIKVLSSHSLDGKEQ
ncbi:hypothetical protein BDN71DRAFT_1436867 [Pleurotus eryngii]|uniref:Uncharacterized protein n=1 Tax=Pleurotus eryngii TaxID=5323 RepID=A0A9P5ZHB6_PLEER|nr:hypothetical protein BDN71DRAFT_1436867 [Pleurotus eryngii]